MYLAINYRLRICFVCGVCLFFYATLMIHDHNVCTVERLRLLFAAHTHIQPFECNWVNATNAKHILNFKFVSVTAALSHCPFEHLTYDGHCS